MGSQTGKRGEPPQLLSGREVASASAPIGELAWAQRGILQRRDTLAYEAFEAQHDLALTPPSASLRARLSHPALPTLV